MAIVRGITLTLALFVAVFALHIVGGATDQGWLFVFAVCLIYLVATGFPVFALALAGRKADVAARRVLWAAGGAIGVGLTAGALWAAADRSFAWWTLPAAVALTTVTSGLLILGWRELVEKRAFMRELESGLRRNLKRDLRER